MRLLLRLESEQNDRAIRYILFWQSPKEIPPLDSIQERRIMVGTSLTFFSQSNSILSLPIFLHYLTWVFQSFRKIII